MTCTRTGDGRTDGRRTDGWDSRARQARHSDNCDLAYSSSSNSRISRSADAGDAGVSINNFLGPKHVTLVVTRMWHCQWRCCDVQPERERERERERESTAPSYYTAVRDVCYEPLGSRPFLSSHFTNKKAGYRLHARYYAQRCISCDKMTVCQSRFDIVSKWSVFVMVNCPKFTIN